jgi:hypothetical protein
MDRIFYLNSTGHKPGNIREGWSSSSGPSPSPGTSSFPDPTGRACVTYVEVPGESNPACD